LRSVSNGKVKQRKGKGKAEKGIIIFVFFCKKMRKVEAAVFAWKSLAHLIMFTRCGNFPFSPSLTMMMALNGMFVTDTSHKAENILGLVLRISVFSLDMAYFGVLAW